MKKLTLVLPLVLTLAACGGGGGGGGSGSGTAGPSAGTPSTGTPSTGTPSTGTPSTGTPSTGTPSTGTPSTDTPSTGTPSTGTPTTETPGTGTPSTGTPSTDTPSTGTPSTGTDTPQVLVEKYIGTFLSECVVGSRKRATFTRVSADTLSLALNNEYYADTACKGALVGNVSYTAPVTMKFTGTREGGYYYRPAGFQDGGTLETSVPLDHFTGVVPDTQLVFSGSAVAFGTSEGKRAACIDFTDTRASICADVESVTPGVTTEYAVYLKGTVLYLGGPQDATQPAPYNTLHPVQIPYVKQ